MLLIVSKNSTNKALFKIKQQHIPFVFNIVKGKHYKIKEIDLALLLKLNSFLFEFYLKKKFKETLSIILFFTSFLLPFSH